MSDVVCPRCAVPVAEPTLFDHRYRCPQHGEVAAVVPAVDFHADHVAALAPRVEVPIWYPQPMPDQRLFSGLRWAHTPRRRVQAIAVTVTGWPDSARGLVDDDLRLADGRTGPRYAAFPVGARSPQPGQR